MTPSEFKLNGNTTERRDYRITDDYMEAIFLPMIGISFLREIDLSFNDFGDKGAKLLARLIIEDKYLEILNLNSNSIGDTGTEALCKALQLNERIHSFNLSNNPIGDMGGMEIARMLQVNNCITHLWISGTGLKATSLIAIWTVVKNNDVLTALDISNNMSNLHNLTQSIANDVMLHLSRAISGQNTLKYLNLSRMCITDWSTTDYFANALGTCYNLDTLDLTAYVFITNTRNKISRDGGVAIFKALAKHTFISTLILTRCSIQDEGAYAVNEFLLTNTSLKKLYLDYNKITSRGLMDIALALSRNYSVEYIALWGNQWDNLACQAFAPLVGGPIYSVSIQDDLKLPVLPRNTALFQFENADTDNVIVRKRKGKSRLRRNGTDVTFYSVEGTLNVAESH